MKQSTLSFAAGKRTASVAKTKVSGSIVSPASEKPKAVKSSKRVSPKRSDASDEEADDEVTSKETSEEETVASTPDVSESGNPHQTRSKAKAVPLSTIKKISEKVQDLETRRSLPFKESNVKPEVLQNKANAIDLHQLPELDPSSKKWNKQYAAARAKQGRQTSTHGKSINKVHEILRVFDNSSEYGPCIGMTRLERWERAESLGLNPPKEIYEILTTKEGQTSNEYKESVFHGEV